MIADAHISASLGTLGLAAALRDAATQGATDACIVRRADSPTAARAGFTSASPFIMVSSIKFE